MEFTKDLEKYTYDLLAEKLAHNEPDRVRHALAEEKE